MKRLTIWLVLLLALSNGIKAQGIEFKDKLGGRRQRDRVPISFHLYEASDGIGVSTTIEAHNSPANANKELQRIIRKAYKIIERGLKLDREGKTVGKE